MSETGDMLRATAAEALRDLVTDEARASEFPRKLWMALDELGLPHALAPEAAGGFGVPIAEALSLLTVVGEYAPPLPLADAMLARFLLGKAGVEAPAGVLTVAPAAEVVVTRDGRAVGHAWGVPWGRHADAVVLVIDRALIVVPKAEMRVEPGVDIAGDPCDTIYFEGVKAHKPRLSAMQARATGAATRALMMAGALRTVSEMAVQYAEERKQFGRALGKFQAIQQQLAMLAGQAASAAAAADMAAEAVDTWGDGLVPAVAAAKARCGEAAGVGAAIAHQTLGAIGFTREHRLHHYTSRLWAWRDQYGREAEWARALGAHLADAGPEGLWPTLTAI